VIKTILNVNLGYVHYNNIIMSGSRAYYTHSNDMAMLFHSKLNHYLRL